MPRPRPARLAAGALCLLALSACGAPAAPPAAPTAGRVLAAASAPVERATAPATAAATAAAPSPVPTAAATAVPTAVPTVAPSPRPAATATRSAPAVATSGATVPPSPIKVGADPALTSGNGQVAATVTLTNTDTAAHAVSVQANFYDVPRSALGADPADHLVTAGTGAATLAAGQTLPLTISARNVAGARVLSVAVEVRLSAAAGPPPAAVPGGHTFYASSYEPGRAAFNAHLIYCDDDPGWQGLSPTYLVHYPTLAAAQAALPGYQVHRPC